MFYQNWKLSIVAIIMIPLASIAARVLGKRMGKVTTQQMNEAGVLNSYLIEVFKNHRLTKIFQKEEYEKDRANKFINKLKEISKKILTKKLANKNFKNIKIFYKDDFIFELYNEKKQKLIKNDFIFLRSALEDVDSIFVKYNLINEIETLI